MAQSQQHLAAGIVTKRIGEKILQDAAQKFGIRIYLHATADHPEIDPLARGQGAELRRQGVKYLGKGKRPLVDLQRNNFV